MQHNYLAYTRVSTAKQGEGVSLQEQKESIRRYASRENFTISRWFEEKETAAKRGRPVFGEMLKILEKGEARGVIIHKIDRSARNLKDWANLGELIDAGIEVHFANESLDLNSRGGRLSADIQAVVAADYIRNLREETRKGFYGRLKQGLYPLRAPIGYLDNGGGKPKTIDPVTGPLVRQAFELYASGTISLRDLADEMYRRGLRSQRNGKVNRTGWSNALRNPFYIGIMRVRSTGEVFPGVHETLIPKRLFDRVQGVLDGKVRKGSNRHAFLFRRLFRCEACGYSLIGERQKGHVYYRCHTSDCTTTGFREEALDRAIRKRLEPLMLTRDELRYLLQKVVELRVKWENDREKRERALRLQRAKIGERLTALTDALLDGIIDKPLFEERKEALLLERREIDDQLSGGDTTFDRIPDKLQEFLELAESAETSYEEGDRAEKRDFLQIVTSNRTVRGKQVEITLKEPFQLIAERAPVLQCGPCRARHRILDGILAGLIKYCRQEEEAAAAERP